MCDSSLGNGLKGRVERGTLCSEKRLKDYFGKKESKYSRNVEGARLPESIGGTRKVCW